jgi:hypothetical protein
MVKRTTNKRQQTEQAAQPEVQKQLVVGWVLDEKSPWEINPVDVETAKATMEKYKAEGVVIINQANGRATTILRPLQVVVFDVLEGFAYQPPQQETDSAQVVPSEPQAAEQESDAPAQ